MYVIIGNHFVPLEGKFLLIALVIVNIVMVLSLVKIVFLEKSRFRQKGMIFILFLEIFIFKYYSKAF